MNKNCIIILYEGLTPSEYVINEIATALDDNCVTVGDITVSHLDETSIVQAIASKVINLPVEKQEKANQEMDPVKAAAILLNEKYGELMAQPMLYPFVGVLAKDLREAKAKAAFNPAHISDDDKALIEAVDIVSDITIPPAIAKKYHIYKNVIEAVRYVRQNV